LRPLGLRGVDLHSLRHAFASVGAHVADGRYTAFVGPLLGHGYTKGGMTDRHITRDPDALRPAADAIADEIAIRLGLTERGKVLELSQAFDPSVASDSPASRRRDGRSPCTRCCSSGCPPPGNARARSVKSTHAMRPLSSPSACAALS
jgi:hypothetical protein